MEEFERRLQGTVEEQEKLLDPRNVLGEAASHAMDKTFEREARPAVKR